MLGVEHPDTLICRNNRALLYQSNGDHDKSLPLYEHTLAARERVLGLEHPSTLISRNNLALLYESKEEYDKALPLYEQTLAASERALGPEHPHTITIRDNLDRCRNEIERKGEQAKPKS